MQMFEETKDRSQISTAVDEAQAALMKAAALLRKTGRRARAHLTINIAQSCSNINSLLALDWHEEDARKVSDQVSEAGDQAA